MSLCPDCHIGTLHETTTTYVRRMGDMLVTLPNVLTWVCDICGEHSYDEDTLERLETLLGPEASFSREPPTRRHRRPADAGGRSLRDWT